MFCRAFFLKWLAVGLVMLMNNWSQAQDQMELNDKDQLIYKDSVGTIISRKQALELLRTGKYISVPAMNSLMQMENIIRKPTKEDGDRFRTYTDHETVIATSGIKNADLKYNLGDTLPAFNVSSLYGEQSELHKELSNEMSVLLFYQSNDRVWREAEPSIKNLLSEYPAVNFILCSQEESTLYDFFDKRTLKVHRTIFLAEHSFSKEMSVKHFPAAMIINRTGKLLMLVPPLPRQEIAIMFLKKYLSSTNKN